MNLVNQISKSSNSSKQVLSMLFPKIVFWDCDVDQLDLNNWEDRSFIIQRVLKMSEDSSERLVALERLFSIEEIKYYAKGSMEIMGNELIEQLSKRYGMTFSQFPYYRKNVDQYAY